MPNREISGHEIVQRLDSLRRVIDGQKESWDSAAVRWGPMPSTEKHIDRTTISHWNATTGTREKTVPSLEYLAKIADAEGVSLDWLVFGPDRDPEPSAYAIVQSLVQEVRAVLDDAVDLLPETRRLELVRRDVPETRGEDPESHE